MKYYSGDGVGKTFVIELDRGEELFESVESILEKEGVRNAFIASAVGSVAHLEYHRPTSINSLMSNLVQQTEQVQLEFVTLRH